MRKVLLLCAMLLSAIGAWAQPTASNAPVGSEWAANTTWFTVGTVNDYYLIANGGSFLSNVSASNGDKGRWCLVGDNTNGYYLYNKATGPGKVFAMKNSAPSMQVPGAEGYTTKFFFKESQKVGAWCIRTASNNNECFDCGATGSQLGTWNSTDAYNNNSSAFYFLTIEFASDAESITAWYYLRLNKNQQRYIKNNLPTERLTRTSDSPNIAEADADKHLWGFVGKYGDVKIVNKADKSKGFHYDVNAQGQIDGNPTVGEPTVFKIERNTANTVNTEMFFLQCKDKGNNAYLNGGDGSDVAFWSKDDGCVVTPIECKEFCSDISEANGYSTLLLDYQAYIPEGVEAYVVSETTETSAKLEPVTTGVLPANTGVVLKNSGTHKFRQAIGAATAPQNNLLFGYTSKTPVAGSGHENVGEGGTVYALAKKNNVIAFYHYDAENYLPGKAYLQIPAGTESRFLVFNFGDDNATSIEKVEGEANGADAAIYDLAGRRVQKSQKGLYIVGGKKVVF